MSFEEFINMDGFGFYIWTSYAITAIVFIGLFVMFKVATATTKRMVIKPPAGIGITPEQEEEID